MALAVQLGAASAPADILLAFRSVDYLAVLDAEDFVKLAKPILQTFLGERSADAMIELIADQLDISDAQARSIWTTLDQMTRRQTKALDADADGQAPFMYLGPVDAAMRDFCADHVGKVYTRREIDRMDNEQLPDVFLTAGGYNCRHIWEPVSRTDARMKRLLRSKQRFEPVTKRLRRVTLRRAA